MRAYKKLDRIMEVSQLRRSLQDLEERAVSLRGFL